MDSPEPYMILGHSKSVYAASVRIAFLPLLFCVAILSVSMTSGWAAEPITLAFESHGAFFSNETHQAVAIDPQVFVQMPGAPAGVGPQGITNTAGFIPVGLSAPPETPLYAADGKALNFTLDRWLGARGTAEVEATETHTERVKVSFTGLIAGGTYSLFAVTFGPGGNSFAPLDGTGNSDTFVAIGNGTARATVTTQDRLIHANAILLVYHSDARAHGTSRGVPCATAHHQLIARIP